MQAVNSKAMLHKPHHVAPIPAATVLKAGVCVGFIALLAWIGAGDRSGQAPAAITGAQSAAAAAVGDRAATHRKQVFDERRARFDGAAHAKVARGEASVARTEVLAP